MTTIYDVAIIGAGAVGSAIARELSKYDLKVVLLESNPDVGMGTSKASTAIWHTGYDAVPGSLESRLLKRGYPLLEKFMREVGSPFEVVGGLLIAWNEEQFRTLPKLLEKAIQNEDTDCYLIDRDEVYKREPHLGAGAMGGMVVPREGILCTFTIPLACAAQAVVNGAELKLGFRVEEIEQLSEDGGQVLESENRKDDVYRIASKDEAIHARWIINAAGLYADDVNKWFRQEDFKVTPRRGELIVFDKLARRLVNHVLLPVPTATTKGVLVSPTIYGNVLLGPTAEDLPDKTATNTSETGLQSLLEKGRKILPALLQEEVTALYAGLRAATENSDYQISLHAEQRYVCVGGIRSTGISGCLGIAEHVADLLGEAGLILNAKPEFQKIMMPNIGEAFTRPYQNAEMIERNSDYAKVICHCERVTVGELKDAMKSAIPATTLDALRRRTRAMQGRCQGFNCQAALISSLRASDSERHLHHAQVLSNLQHREEIPSWSEPPLATSADVLIIGAGPAGLSAAIELKKQGIRDVLVVDREAEAGGMPRLCHHTGFGRYDLYRMYSGQRYARYYRELAEKAGVEIRTTTTITGWDLTASADSESHSNPSQFKREGVATLNFTSPDGIGTIEARAVLLATGVRERPRSARLIPGTRPQGVYTTGSLQRFVYQEHLPVGKRAVIVGAELISLSALLTLMHAEVKCEAMITESPHHQIYFPYLPMKWWLADILTRTKIKTTMKVINISGKTRVEGIEIRNLESGEIEKLECDALIFTGDWIPEHEMARLGGLVIDPGTRGVQVDSEFRSSVKGVFAAGNLLHGVATADHCALEGQRAAWSIARYLENAGWPASRLEVGVEAPLKFIYPNVIASQVPSYFQFQSREFLNHVQLRISQGERILYRQDFSRVIVNEFIRLRGDWVQRVDPSGAVLKATLVPQ